MMVWSARVLMVALAFCYEAGAHKLQAAEPPHYQEGELISHLIKTLDSSNPLRAALESGRRGDGIHQSWMDGMKQQGIKQASFRIRFTWEKGSVRFQIVNVKYLRQYYQFNTAVKAARSLRAVPIKLKNDLRGAILVRAKADVESRFKDSKNRRICGTLYLNLLDNEILPILDEIPHLDYGCRQ